MLERLHAVAPRLCVEVDPARIPRRRPRPPVELERNRDYRARSQVQEQPKLHETVQLRQANWLYGSCLPPQRVEDTQSPPRRLSAVSLPTIVDLCSTNRNRLFTSLILPLPDCDMPWPRP